MLDARLARILVDLAGILDEEEDVADLMQRLVDALVDLLPAAEAGLLILDDLGHLSLAASTDESAELMELFQLKAGDGPCIEAVHGGHPVTISRLVEPGERWPTFAAHAVDLGFESVLALPLRHQDQVIGGVNVFGHTGEIVAPEVVATAQALADAAAIALVGHRRLGHATTLNEQLERALTSRVAVEQAKGVLAEHAGIDVGVAFEALRTYSRQHRLKLSVVAARVVSRTLPAPEVLGRAQ